MPVSISNVSAMNLSTKESVTLFAHGKASARTRLAKLGDVVEVTVKILNGESKESDVIVTFQGPDGKRFHATPAIVEGNGTSAVRLKFEMPFSDVAFKVDVERASRGHDAHITTTPLLRVGST